MSRRALLNVGLVLLVLALSYYARQNPVDTSPQSLSSLTADKVDSIVLQREDGLEMVIEREDENWLIRSPKQATANSETIRNILGILDLSSRYRHTLTKDSQYNRYELDRPKITLFLNDQQFDFGGLNPFNQHRYVLSKGTVHTVKDSIYPVLNGPISSFIAAP